MRTEGRYQKNRSIAKILTGQIKIGEKSLFCRHRNCLAVCLLVLLTGGIYLNSLGNLFTNWDDAMIYGNPQIRSLSWENIRNIFTYVRGSTYQPIRVLSYALDFRFWGLNPIGYHMTNVLFYILTCLMVFSTLRLLSASLREGAETGSHFRVALFGSLLFAAHPVHVEAVTWLAARKEVLQSFFFFLAFFLYLKGRMEGAQKKIVYFGLALFSILLATLSKPSAVVFPAVLLVFEIAQRKGRWTDFLKRHAWFLGLSVLISGVFTFILIKVMVDAGGIKPYHGGSLSNNLLSSLYAFLYNIKLLLLTINFSAAYTIDVPNAVGPRTLFLVGLTLSLLAVSIWSLKKTKVIFFAFFFFLITVLPYLNLVPISTLLADRYVFIASFAYAFLAGMVFDGLYGFKRKGLSEGFFRVLSTALFLFLLAGYSFMTVEQNKIWENSYTLWADAVEKYPDSNTANALMGVVYMELGMDEKAVDFLEKAVEILPYDYQSRNNLGIVYGRLGEPEKALKEFLTALWLNPDGENIKINLAVFFQRQKEYEKAVMLLKELLAKRPKSALLYFRLGLVYKEMGQFDAAISEFIRSMELAPTIINPYEELGNIYLSGKGDRERAKFYYSKGIEAAPGATDRIEDLRWMIQDLELGR